MKSFNLFLESFKTDEKKLQTDTRISNIDLAHSLALTTCAFEFECYLNVKKDFDINDLENIYNIFKKRITSVFKTNKIKVSTEYHGIPTEFKIANPDYWFVEYDGSLTNVPSRTHVPVEIISPWIPAKDAVKFVKKFKEEIFDFFNGITNSSTGFHVNLKTKNAIANPLKLLLLLDDRAELKKFKREHNEYAQFHKKKNIFGNLYLFGQHYDLSKPEILKHVTAHVIDIMPKEKRFSINVKDYNFENGSGRIEFRIIGNDYLGSLFEKCLASVNRFVMLMASATDEGSHLKDIVSAFNKAITVDPALVHPSDLLDQVIRYKKALAPEYEKIMLTASAQTIFHYVSTLNELNIPISDAVEKYLANDPRLALAYEVIITGKPFNLAKEALDKLTARDLYLFVTINKLALPPKYENKFLELANKDLIKSYSVSLERSDIPFSKALQKALED